MTSYIITMDCPHILSPIIYEDNPWGTADTFYDDTFLVVSADEAAPGRGRPRGARASADLSSSDS